MAKLQASAVKLITEICERYKDEPTSTMMILEDIQKEYLDSGFSRINRSILVNLAHVNGYTSTDVTAKGENLPLSRVYKTDFLHDLTLYLGKKH